MTIKATSKPAAAKPATRKTKHLQHEFNPKETNFAILDFPADPAGVTTKLRHAFRETVQRCRGNHEKFQQVLDNLEILAAWAQAKLEDDKATNARNAAAAAARAAEAAREEAFRARIQAGPTVRVTATSTGFIEQSPRTGAVFAVYDTADDARGPVAAMAQMMLAEGRDPNSVLEIQAFGRPGVGSGQTVRQLASGLSDTDTPAPAARETAGSLVGIRV